LIIPITKSSVLFDGFPRTLVQAEKLDEMLAEKGSEITSVINFKIDDSLVVERVCGRWTHKESGRTYHIKSRPPKIPFKDDITGEIKHFVFESGSP
jgi:adenylate kinase